MTGAVLITGMAGGKVGAIPHTKEPAPWWRAGVFVGANLESYSMMSVNRQRNP